MMPGQKKHQIMFIQVNFYLF